MRFEKSKQLYSYWLNLKGSRAAPERNEIEPSDIRTLLGDTFILEINHQAKYVIYRLAGTRLCASYGRELKGLGYLVHWNEEDNLDVLQSITSVYTNNIPCVISHHNQTDQKRFVEFETLMLPLAPIDDGTSRILGISSPGKVPFWLGAEPITSHRLRSVRQMRNSNQREEHDKVVPVLTPPPLQSGMANSEIAQNTSMGKKVGHLTLLDGGKT